MIAFHKIPEKPIFPYPLVFIHGAWHDSFYWHPLTDYLAERGFEIYAIDLPGHGDDSGTKNINLITFQSYINDVEKVVSDIGKEPVLIGHSMGGMIVQKYLQNHTCKAAILMAPVPSFGVYKLVLNAFMKLPLTTLKALITGNLYYMINSRPKADYWLYNDHMTESEKQKYFMHLQRESFMAFFVLMFPKLKKNISEPATMLIIAAQNDKLFSVEDLEQTARFHQADFQVVENSPHNLMLVSVEQTAERMIKWLDSKFASNPEQKKLKS